MRKRFLSLLMLPFLLLGCGTKKENFDTKTAEVARKTGAISSFKLLTPENGFVTNKGFTFTWEAADNADYYQLEICNLETFENDPDEVYVKENNLSQPKFDLTYDLPKKEVEYFWRVTAFNQDHKTMCDDRGVFTYNSSNDGEIEIEIEDADDWALHKEGSYADVKIDRSNFFNNGKNALAITFDKEHTSQGIAKSDGWIVITKTEDRELYGADSFYFNFFYSGQDATVLIRVLDYDGEYWHQQVRIANNAKQTILMRRENFTLRTAGTNINNRKFDWDHIRYFEIVFERTFGDGVCLISDIRAVQLKNYKHMFMEKMDFKRDDIDNWTYESYNFTKTVSTNGNELTIGYSPSTGFAGWGLQHVFLYKYFSDGDALKFKFKYTGSSAGANFYFRILEEDRDIWQYKMPFTYFTKNEYKELIVPLKAFQRLEGGMNGDGAKQLTFIQKLMFGLSDNYAEGTISIKDFETFKIDDIIVGPGPEDKIDRTRKVGSDGLIENFNDYDVYTEIYYYWYQSEVNKDEAMKLDTAHKTGGRSNTYCAEFDYKADMEQAVYQLYMNCEEAVDKKSLSLWLKDDSIKSDNPIASSVDEEKVTAEMEIQLTMDSGEWYRYKIEQVGKEWNRYVISFEDFKLFNKDDLLDDPHDLSSEHIIHMAFGFRYLYYNDEGVRIFTYAIANPVYIDEIYLSSEETTSITELPGTLKPDTEDNTRITVDTFEEYATEEDMLDNWSFAKLTDNHLMALSKVEKSSQGGTTSLKLQYKGETEVEYVRKSPFARTNTARGVAVDIKAANAVVIYFYLNVKSGKNIIKMRATIVANNDKWMRYEIGFDHFVDAKGTTYYISEDDIKAIDNISFGVFDSLKGEDAGNIYVDNIRLLRTCDFDRNYKTQIV